MIPRPPLSWPLGHGNAPTTTTTTTTTVDVEKMTCYNAISELIWGDSVGVLSDGAAFTVTLNGTTTWTCGSNEGYPTNSRTCTSDGGAQVLMAVTQSEP